jgi:hypothetical protein
MASYGNLLDAEELSSFLDFFMEANLARESATGSRPTPVCIWGTHGIGKTEVVRALAKGKGWPLAYCAPAQFEEMGDLHGLPVKVIADDSGRHGYTSYLPPQWVPREEGPGILLLDDINRADDRILRGLMQLLQNFEMFSWSLPPKWQIVLTANPDAGNYSVTPMDDAMLTRMFHATMKFDTRIWGAWALKAGVHPVGVDFVLTYPEAVTGVRTTPRSLVQVFSKLPAHISELKHNLSRVATIARGALDEETVSAFLSYVNDELEFLISPADILEAENFDEVRARIVAASRDTRGTVRLDRLSTICTRLLLAVAGDAYGKPSARNIKNVVQFLMIPELPADLRFSLHRDIVSLAGDRPNLVKDAALAKLVLGSV